MISLLSKQLSNFLSTNVDLSDEKKEELSYGFELIFLTTISFCSIILVAYFFDALIPTALVTFFGGSLRKLSGGAHASSALKCLTIGTLIYVLLGVLAKNIILYNLANQMFNLIILFTCLIIVSILAPVDCPAKPIHSQSFRKKLKLASIIFIVLVLALVFFTKSLLFGTSAALGIAFQTMTLLPMFNSRKGG